MKLTTPPSLDRPSPLRRLHGWFASRRSVIGRRFGERGQGTAEYALLVLGVASIALLVLAWAGGTDMIGRLFDRVVQWVMDRVG